MFCGNCGKAVNEGAAFCPHCGTKTGAAGNAAGQQQYRQPVMYAQTGGTAQKTSPWQYFCNVLKKYAVFRGRARRAEYWFFVLFYYIFYLPLALIDNVAGLLIAEETGLLSTLLALAWLLPAWGVMVRRLHDVDRRGWWILVPVYGIILLFFAGTPGPNRFGEDPKQAN